MADFDLSASCDMASVLVYNILNEAIVLYSGIISSFSLYTVFRRNKQNHLADMPHFLDRNPYFDLKFCKNPYQSVSLIKSSS